MLIGTEQCIYNITMYWHNIIISQYIMYLLGHIIYYPLDGNVSGYMHMIIDLFMFVVNGSKINIVWFCVALS